MAFCDLAFRLESTLRRLATGALLGCRLHNLGVAGELAGLRMETQYAQEICTYSGPCSRDRSVFGSGTYRRQATD
jgi:hypothetical protein